MTPIIAQNKLFHARLGLGELYRRTNDGLRPTEDGHRYREARFSILQSLWRDMQRNSASVMSGRPLELNRHQRKRERQGAKLRRCVPVFGLDVWFRNF